MTVPLSQLTKKSPNHFFNPFVPNAPFLYLLKTSENRKEVEKGCIGNKWVNFDD